MLISNAERKLLRLGLQFFADGGEGDGADGADDGAGGSDADNKQDNQHLSTEAIEKLVQSRVDKQMAEERKKSAGLQKELDKMKREKLSEDEIKKLEISDKEKALAEKEKALTEKENRLFAIKAIKESGLDDGSQQSLELVDFVMGENEEAITSRVKAFKSLVDRFVTAKVNETFKANGRVPNGGGKGGEDDKSNIGTEIGKRAAEAQKKSNDILKHYYGG